jgi:hypothetical protein
MGTPMPTAFGTAPVSCLVSNWGGSARVECRNPAGALVDSAFDLAYLGKYIA